MSHNSPRSMRIKQEARTRPDVIHKEQPIRIDSLEVQDVLSGGSELSQLVKKSDSLLVAMRKIVH